MQFRNAVNSSESWAPISKFMQRGRPLGFFYTCLRSAPALLDMFIFCMKADWPRLQIVELNTIVYC